MAKGNSGKQKSGQNVVENNPYLDLDSTRLADLQTEYNGIVNFPALVYDCPDCPKTGYQETYYIKLITNTSVCDDCGGILRFRNSNLDLLEHAKLDTKVH